MPTLNGNSLFLAVNGVRVGGETSCSASLSIDTLEVTKNNTNTWSEAIIGNRGLSINFEGLLSKVELQPMVELDFEFVIGFNAYFGRGYIESESFSGGTDDAPTYSGTIMSTGEVEFGHASFIENLHVITSTGTAQLEIGGKKIRVREPEVFLT